MEYVIGVASVAKGYSGYVDQIFHHELSNAFNAYVPIKVEFLSDYFDAFAFSITIVLTLLLSFGVKESSFVNNFFTALNLGVVIFVIVAGSFYADPKNWALRKEDILNSTANMTSEKVGDGGFAPFGFHGIMKGAATCFYGFVGFDCIATTGEEAKNPQRSIPIAIIFSLLFIFLAYFGISVVLTMMVPYYLQDSEAPLPQAFLRVDFTFGQWVVTAGALFGLSTSLLGAMFPMPRVIYAMASDGVLFKFLAKVHPRFHTPLIATLIAGTFGGLMAAIFRLEALIDMMSIGTLTAYTLVAVCVLCLRYRKDVDGADDIDCTIDSSQTLIKMTSCNYFGQIFNSMRSTRPTELSSAYTNYAVAMYCVITGSFCAVAIFAEDRIIQGSVGPVCALAILGIALILILISLASQPVSRVKISFKVPCVPLIPGLSILANTYLIMKLSGMTWIRFSVWMGLGFLIYAICLLNGTTDKAYALSLENKNKNKRKYSKVSASGFHNKGLMHFRNGKLVDEQHGHNETEMAGYPNGSCDTGTGKDTVSLASAQNRTKTEIRRDVEKNEPPSPISKQVETETIEKSVEFDDGESQEAEAEYPSAEKAAVEAIDFVISEAYKQPVDDSKSKN
ncbi:cationic amino acid transporter 2 isoform X2 [Folsomia candida]|nr:cationic amino acid transporter 2 isoform X2 [Folsomia candida]